MNEQKLTDFIAANTPHLHPSTAHIQTVAAAFTAMTLEKGEYLLKQGKRSGYFILLDGVLRAFGHTPAGDEVTLDFFSAPRVVFEAASFFLQQPSDANIVALTDCEGYYADFETLNRLFHQSPEFREFGRAILVKEFVVQQRQKLALATQSAEQRYRALIADNPDLFQHAALKHIASFLGITDSSLSRIRREYSTR